MIFEKVEKRRIITFYFKTSTVDVGECIPVMWPSFFVESESQALRVRVTSPSCQSQVRVI